MFGYVAIWFVMGLKVNAWTLWRLRKDEPTARLSWDTWLVGSALWPITAYELLTTGDVSFDYRDRK